MVRLRIVITAHYLTARVFVLAAPTPATRRPRLGCEAMGAVIRSKTSSRPTTVNVEETNVNLDIPHC